MLRQRVNNAGFWLIGFFFGTWFMLLAVRYYLGIQGLWDFTFFELLKFVAMVFIAIFIAYYLKNRYSDRQIKKQVFLDIGDNLRDIFEEKMEELLKFMEKESRSREDRNRMLLLLKRLSNKIRILEEHKNDFESEMAGLIETIREDYSEIKSIVTGDDKFSEPGAYCVEASSKVMRLTYKILFNIDQVKLRLFV